MNTLANIQELARALRNMIRTGIIVETDLNAGRCRVQTGGMCTDWLQWLTHRAGRSRTWWAPSVGEQVLILAVGGELDTAFVLPGIYSGDNPAPSASADALHIRFPDGAVIEYEPETSALTVHTKDPKPQKQKVKLKRKKKEKHLRALEHPKAKPVTQKKAPKVPEAREGEYMAGEADNVFALTTVYATKAQAMRAAQAKWDKLQRGVAEFSISLATGRADIYTETPVKVSGFKRVIDEQDWTITKVTHFLNNSGFTTSLELEVRLSDVEYETEDDE
ncbi:phage baseplate assembly protein V [Escherichia coli]|nr:phage baseplate assembly protein V [Escherichia coli]